METVHERPAQARRLPRRSARSWISKTVKWRWNLPPAGAKSTYSKQTQPRRATSFEPTANIKTEPVMNIIYQAGTFWGGLLNQSFRYLPGPLIPNPIQRHRLSRPPSSRCRPESCPTFSPESVWHPSFTLVTTRPPPPAPPRNAAPPLSFSSSIVPGSEIQPGRLCSPVISTGSILACAADKQPNTEMMNKSQYSVCTLADTRRRPFIWFILWVILNQICCAASCCIVWLRLNNPCWRFTMCASLFLEPSAQNKAKICIKDTETIDTDNSRKSANLFLSLWLLFFIVYFLQTHVLTQDRST